jgi:hypothetical protein
VAGIFISYRRGDSIGHTGRLYDLLSQHFGSAHVFMDIDTIGPGEDYLEVIEKRCDSCEVLLAIIGRSWVNAVDQNGNRRLDDPGDFVRLEIMRALEKGIRVVPVLVDAAQMPDAKDLPPELKKFTLRNAWEINDKRFHHDVGLLIGALQKMQPTLQPRSSPSKIEEPRLTAPATKSDEPCQEQQRTLITRKSIYVGIGAVVVLVLGLVTYFEWFKSTPPEPTGAESRGTYDIPSLQATVAAPLLFFMFEPSRPVPPPGQRPYATSFRSGLSSGKRIFWEASLNFQGQFPPPDYQIESVWYRNSKEVFRGIGTYKGSDVSTRAFHNRYGWDPPEGHLPVGQYRVDLYVAGRRITTGEFVVPP